MKVVYSVFCFFCFFWASAQEADSYLIDQITAFVENADQAGEFDFNTLLERFELLQKNPIDLNKVDSDELLSIGILTNLQVNNLLEHRTKLGFLDNYYELQTVPGFTPNIIRILKEITKIDDTLGTVTQNLKKVTESDHSLFIKWKRGIQTLDGYKRTDSTGYLGSPDHLYLRYRGNIGTRFQAGFIAEKDNGEPFYYPNKIYGADYYSFHIAAKNLTKRIKFLTIGDYAASFGQGLILYNGFGAGKSAVSTNIRKGGYTLRSYSSVAEFNFLRGIATTIALSNNVETTIFGSHKSREGTLQDSDQDDPFNGNFVSSLSEAGYHRTMTEIEKKNSVKQSTVGGQIKYKFRRGHIAVNGLYDHLNVPLRNNNALYQKFNINSNQNWNASLDYGYIWRNFNVFGEIASSTNLGIAQIHGLMMGLDRTLDLSIAYRNYSREYVSLNANAFGESINANNENGVYLGIEYRPSKSWIINGYADSWRHPWLKFRIDGPSYGTEYFLRIKYFKKRKWDIYTQYFYESKLRNLDGKIDQLAKTTKQRFRIHGSYKINKAIELRNRVEVSYFDSGSESPTYGFLIYQDLIYKPIGRNLSFTTRYGFFDIEDYDARIYAYENDILNEYYIPAYNGQGLRFYFNARWRATRHIKLEGRYEITKYNLLNNQPLSDANSIGSGLTRIDGDVRSLFKFQIKYSW